METVRSLTAEQAQALRGQTYRRDSYFGPTTDGNGVWIIANEEAELNENADFAWVADLPKIPYVKPTIPNDDPLYQFATPK